MLLLFMLLLLLTLLTFAVAITVGKKVAEELILKTFILHHENIFLPIDCQFAVSSQIVMKIA